MRFLVAALLLTGCGGGSWDGCAEPCTGGTYNTEYLCDGGPCPPGGALADRYVQCLCVADGGQLHSFVFPEPRTQATCDTAKADWRAFAASSCR
jgi:hypothetical protein